MEHCAVVSTALTAQFEDGVVMTDVEKMEQAEELRSPSLFLPPKCKRVREVVDYILKSDLAEISPNVTIALRISLSIMGVNFY